MISFRGLFKSRSIVVPPQQQAQAPPPLLQLNQVCSTEPSTESKEIQMSFETVVLKGVKDVEIGIEDAVKIFTKAQADLPAATVALTALAGAVDKALADVASDATNPSTLLITLPTTVSDFKAIWADGKTLLTSIGVK